MSKAKTEKKILAPGEASRSLSTNNDSGALPKMLAGTVHTQWVRCGRDGCRCAKGQLHGPYSYRFYREGGRLRKQYVKRADVPAVMEACNARKVLVSRRRANYRAIVERVKQDRARWREIEQTIKRLRQGEL